MASWRWIFNRSADSRFGDAVVLAFVTVQALDGVLTYVGVAMVGHVTEGNPLVASLMQALGPAAGLMSAKLGACTLGGILHLTGTHRLIAVLTAIYVAAAILPWTAVLAAAN